MYLIQRDRRSPQGAWRRFGYARSPSNGRNDYISETAPCAAISARLSKYRNDNLSLIYPIINGLNVVDLSASYLRPER